MIKPIQVAHVNLNVTDLERSEKFYTEIMGFHVSGKVAGAIAWLCSYKLDGIAFGLKLLPSNVATFITPLHKKSPFSLLSGDFLVTSCSIVILALPFLITRLETTNSSLNFAGKK